MSVNFCHSAFKPKITCDKVCLDGHEVRNLVLDNLPSPPKGFMVESFIKPPVNIYIEFTCNIEIDRILLNTEVDAQQSTGCEIFSFSAKQPPRLRHSDSRELSSEKALLDCRTFYCIGKGYDTNHTIFCFYNPCFKPRAPYKSWAPMGSRLIEPDSADVRRFVLKHHYVKNLTSASHLSVRITRAAYARIAAIKWIEVWGQPASCCSRLVLDAISKLHADVVCLKPIKDLKKTYNKKDGEEHVSIDPKNPDIPAEFIDPITLEVMAMPVLLPSGDTINQYTLDRFIAEEAKWGRPPNNPFTSIPFSDTAMPVPNSNLKVRIDQFLFKNADVIHVPERTLGRVNSGHSVGISRLIRTGNNNENVVSHVNEKPRKKQAANWISLEDSQISNSLSKKPGYQRGVGNSSQAQCDQINQSKSTSKLTKHKSNFTVEKTITTPLKRKFIDTGSSECLKKTKTELNSGDADRRICNTEIISHVNNLDSRLLDQKPTDNIAHSHEKKLSESLSDALQSTLGNLPSFRKTPVQPTSGITKEKPEAQCFRCSQSSVLYKLLCSHLICRTCLLRETATVVCHICDEQSPKHSIVKIHV